MVGVITLMSCEKGSLPMNDVNHGTSVLLSSRIYETSDYEDFLKNRDVVGTFAVYGGSFDWGRNYGSVWYQNEFDNTNIQHYDIMRKDSIGYITFNEMGMGVLVFVNSDSLFYEIPFTYEKLKNTQDNLYLNISFDSEVVKTYVKNTQPPLACFNYTYFGMDTHLNDIYKWEGDMSDFNGVYKWGGNNISYVKNWENDGW